MATEDAKKTGRGGKFKLRGPTRPLAVRLAETKLRAELLENRITKGQLDKDARDLRKRIYRKQG